MVNIEKQAKLLCDKYMKIHEDGLSKTYEGVAISLEMVAFLRSLKNELKKRNAK